MTEKVTRSVRFSCALPSAPSDRATRSPRAPVGARSPGHNVTAPARNARSSTREALVSAREVRSSPRNAPRSPDDASDPAREVTVARCKGTNARDRRGDLPRTPLDPAEKRPQTTRPKLHAPRRKPHARPTDLCGAQRKPYATQSDLHRPQRRRRADREALIGGFFEPQRLRGRGGSEADLHSIQITLPLRVLCASAVLTKSRLCLRQHPRVPKSRHDGGAEDACADVVHDDAPAAGKPFEFADWPGLEDVEEAKEDDAGGHRGP